MPASRREIVDDPRIPANLRGLNSVAITCQSRLVSIPGFSAQRLKKNAREALEDEGLKVDQKAKSHLVISVAVETRVHPQSMVYAVEVALREPVALPRDSDKAMKGTVDSWRHQTITGIVVPPIDLELFGKSLSQEAFRQVEVFLDDWCSEAKPESSETETEPEAEEPPQPLSDDLAKVKAALEEVLSHLGVGNASKVSIDRFDVSGTKVDFEATITHREKNPAAPIGGKYLYSVTTKAKGNFDIADPATIKDQKVCVQLPKVVGGGERCFSLDGILDVL